MKPGTQIAYVPQHADDDLLHPDVEFGFVTSEKGEKDHFCRYWRKGHFGELRTVSCSELTPNAYLVECDSVDQVVVDQLLEKITKGEL